MDRRELFVEKLNRVIFDLQSIRNDAEGMKSFKGKDAWRIAGGIYAIGKILRGLGREAGAMGEGLLKQ